MAKSTIQVEGSHCNENALIKKEQAIKDAVKLLENAATLLESAGAVAAHRRTGQALDAARFALRKVENLKNKASNARPKGDRPLPSTLNEIKREDGTLRSISYMKGAGRRPPAIAICFRRGRKHSMTTTFSVVGRDINDIYSTAVNAFAEHLGVTSDKQLVNEMLGTREAFMKRYCL